jgi:hypothetical protein
MKLDRIRWKGEATYRALSYYFSVRWNVEGIEAFLDRAFGSFAVAVDPDESPWFFTPNVPPQYSIIRRSSERNPYRLLYGGVEGELTRGNNLESVLGQLLTHVNGLAVRRSGDYLLIHAGAVSTPAGQGVLLPAVSGSGKTTLTAALVRSGFRYLSDEAGAIDPVTRMLHPYHKALTLKEGHASVFPELCPNGDGKSWLVGQWPVPTDEIRAGSAGSPCRIRFIIAPTYQSGAATDVTPVTPAEGAMLLLTNTLNLPVYRGRALLIATDVARQARSYRLVTGNVEDALEAITQLTSRRRVAGAQPA